MPALPVGGGGRNFGLPGDRFPAGCQRPLGCEGRQVGP